MSKPIHDKKHEPPRNEWPEAVQTASMFGFFGWVAWLIFCYLKN